VQVVGDHAVGGAVDEVGQRVGQDRGEADVTGQRVGASWRTTVDPTERPALVTTGRTPGYALVCGTCPW
jgi:hypothetical protein